MTARWTRRPDVPRPRRWMRSGRSVSCSSSRGASIDRSSRSTYVERGSGRSLIRASQLVTPGAGGHSSVTVWPVARARTAMFAAIVGRARYSRRRAGAGGAAGAGRVSARRARATASSRSSCSSARPPPGATTARMRASSAAASGSTPAAICARASSRIAARSGSTGRSCNSWGSSGGAHDANPARAAGDCER
jgi:hypothetical protein